MRYSSIIPLALASILAASTSCQEDNNTIGSSIVQDNISITVDSLFTLTGVTVENPKLQSRTTNQLLGRISESQFGTLSSDFVTQFMPASRLDTTDVTAADIDSLMLVMSVFKGDFVGDSIVPMGLDVYPLTDILPNPIYSDFNPEGHYSPVSIASAMYNLTYTSVDTVYDPQYRQIRVKLPTELGRKLYNEYKRDPGQFASPEQFAKIFPGVYIKNTYGSGRISTITSTMMSLYYHKNVYNSVTERDTLVNMIGNYFAVTPEIITNNNISLTKSAAIEQRVAKGEHILMGPTGYDVRVRFPIPELIARFKASPKDLNVVNTLSFTIPGEVIKNDNGIEPPETILLVPVSKREEFFAGNDLPDGINAFYATWSTADNDYAFGDMSKYLVHLLEKGDVTEDDYTFIITPVSTVYDTTDSYYGTTTLSAINPYVGNPAMVRLLLDKAKIKLTFTSQSVAGIKK